LNSTIALRTSPSRADLVFHALLVVLVEPAVLAVEDLAGQGVAALLEVGLGLDLVAVAGFVGHP
jgi:hypothetical protein